MLRFIKKCVFTAMTFFSFNVLNVNSLEFVSMNNQKSKIKSEIINVNTNEPMFYPYSITINKCKGSCNTINDPYARLCVPDTIKSINVKVFNLMSRTNVTRHIEWHKTCKCNYRLDASVCNKRQRWNEDKCRFECKELIDIGMCDKGFIWNPSNCESECHKSWDVGEYLDYKNLKCRNKLFDKLLEECSENIDGNEMIYNETLDLISLNTIPLNNYKKMCNSCTIYIVLFTIFFIISICISSVIIYFHRYLNNSSNNITNINPGTETIIH